MSVAAMSTAIRSIQTIRHGEGGVLAHEGGGASKKERFPPRSAAAAESC